MSGILLLEIESAVKGAVYLNGVYAGETEGVLRVSAPAERVYIGFFPLENSDGCIYMPCVRRLCPGGVFADDGVIRVCDCGGGKTRVSIHPPCMFCADELPHVISSLDFTAEGRQYTALVYFDRVSAFAVEDSSHKVIFAQTLKSRCGSAKIFLRVINGLPVIIAELLEKKRRLIAVSVHGGKVKKEVYCPCTEYTAAQNGLTVYSDFGDPFGRVRKKVFVGKGGRLVCTESDIASRGNAAPKTHENTQKSFLLAVSEGNMDYAVTLLSPGMRNELSKDDIREFFGSDFSIKDGDPITLIYRKRGYLFESREVRFEFDENGLIDNIIME